MQRYLPGSVFAAYYDLLCDFRNGGYRILGHLAGDCCAAYLEKKRKELHDPQDSPAMTAMLNAYKNKASGADYTPTAYRPKTTVERKIQHFRFGCAIMQALEVSR